MHGDTVFYNRVDWCVLHWQQLVLHKKVKKEINNPAHSSDLHNGEHSRFRYMTNLTKQSLRIVMGKLRLSRLSEWHSPTKNYVERFFLFFSF